MPPANASDVERLEIELLFEAIHRRYGQDFRHYAYDSARRRVLYRVEMESLDSVAALQHRVLHDAEAADRLFQDLSINVSEMFRDPAFFRRLRTQVLPGLAGDGHIKVWHAGCAGGEEAYSMAILLEETGLLGRSQIFATDFNPAILDQAQVGIFPLEEMHRNLRNYLAAGGECAFSDYYHARYEGAAMDARLKRNTVFALHDLARDPPFGEMQLILCRNVLIYFNPTLKERALQLFHDSLAEGGFLCLGPRENLQFSALAPRFEVVDEEHRIYRKAGA